MDVNTQLAIYTLFLALFTFVLAISTVLLWWETRASRLQQSKQALETRQLVRANIAIESGSVTHATVDEGVPGYQVQIVLKNFGTSPAMALRTWIDPPVVDVPSALPFQPRADNLQDLASSQTGAGGVVHTGKFGRFAVDDVAAVRSGTKAIFAWGGVEYTDIFGAPHTFYYRLRITGPQATGQGWALTPHPLGYESS